MRAAWVRGMGEKLRFVQGGRVKDALKCEWYVAIDREA